MPFDKLPRVSLKNQKNYRNLKMNILNQYVYEIVSNCLRKSTNQKCHITESIFKYYFFEKKSVISVFSSSNLESTQILTLLSQTLLYKGKLTFVSSEEQKPTLLEGLLTGLNPPGTVIVIVN